MSFNSFPQQSSGPSSSSSSASSEGGQPPSGGQPWPDVARPNTVPGGNNGVPTNVMQQLTPREREALDAIRGKVTVARRTGAVLGAVTTYMLLQRRKTPPGMAAKIGFTILGAMTGGALLMPAGVFLSRDAVKRVEDPAHFSRVLQTAGDVRRGRVAPGAGVEMAGSDPRNGKQPSSWPQQSGPDAAGAGPAAFPSLPSAQSSSMGTGTTGQTGSWGDEESFDDSVLYRKNGSGAQPASSDFSSQYPGSATSGPDASTTAAPGTQQQQEGGSRWAQLRGERTGQTSSWDRVRQQNAREVYERRNAAGSVAPSSAGAESSAGPGLGRANAMGQDGGLMADPTFGKGVSSSRAQAQKEYEASFERERRGMNG